MFSLILIRSFSDDKFCTRTVKVNQLNICSLPNDKILDSIKFKTLADDKISMARKSKFLFGRVENIVGKEENAGYQHFPLFPQCFQTNSCKGLLKVVIAC